MRFLIPQGIGDAIWALMKTEDVNRQLDPAGKLNIKIACMDQLSPSESRALDFVSRFKFVNSVAMYDVPSRGQGGAALLPGICGTEFGYYNYLPDGTTDYPEIDYVLIPNASLERGIRLEEWLPQFKVNWQVMDSFTFYKNELEEAEQIKEPYAAFFLGSLEGNGRAGHNRNSIWKPEEWVDLGERIMDYFGGRIVVVGGNDDRSYYDQRIVPLLKRSWIDCLGNRTIGTSYAITKKARFMISYQSGMGIVSNYMKVPLGIFWRAKGDSVSPYDFISFEESMASAWADPETIKQGKHMPLIYGRHDVDYIMHEIKERNW